MVVRKLFLYLFVLFWITAKAAFALVDVKAYVDRNSVCAGDTVTLTIEISGNVGSYDNPDIGTIQGARIYGRGSSQQISYINGKINTTISFTYALIPITTGKLHIPSFKVKVDGKQLSTQPIDINVNRCASTSTSFNRQFFPSGKSSSPGLSVRPVPMSQRNEPHNQDTFAVISLSKNKVFVGQPIILTYTVYTRERVAYKGFSQRPDFPGFIKEEVSPARDMNRREVVIGGERYVAADVARFILIPTASGEFEIKPGTLLMARANSMKDVFKDFFSDSFWDSFMSDSLLNTEEEFEVVPAAKKVSVQPLPEPRPKNFSGLVGDFDISASVDKKQIKLGDSITLTIEVKGNAPLESLQDIDLGDLKDCRVYKSSSSQESIPMDDSFEYEKRFEYIIIPEKQGNITIPSLDINYFSPSEGKYKTKRSLPIEIEVLPGRKLPTKVFIPSSGDTTTASDSSGSGVTDIKNDIKFIRDNLMLVDIARYWLSLFWLNILLGLVYFFIRFKDRISYVGFSMKRTLGVRRELEDLLNRKETKDKRSYLLALSSALLKAAQLKYERNITSCQGLLRLLEERGNEWLTDEMRSYLMRLDNAVFGGLDVDDAELEGIIRSIREVIRRWD